jgi:hypothetical protein
MSTYLIEANPIMAVKSEVYFAFQIRRMKELQNAQTHLSLYRPSNYGTITAVLMHMLRHIPHSPPARTGYLRDALRDLHFEKVMDKFGTFFLHDLDLEEASLPSINEDDTDECLLAMGRCKSLKQIKEKMAVDAMVIANEEPTAQFPIGSAPTWEKITSTMVRNPKLLMSQWAWDEKWAMRSTAGRLFVQFTTNYFLTLSEGVLRHSKPPKPKDLKEAMELWSVRSLMALLIDVSFKPSNNGLLGNVTGRRNPSFKDMVHIFFPDSEFDIREKSVWHPFLTKGYIREFHTTIYSMTEKDSASLLRALGRILGRVQCLPNAVACTQRACGRLWEQFEGGVRMLTNPVFYKIERVGKAKRLDTRRGKQVKAGKAIIEARLDEEHRHIPFNEGRLKARKVKKARKRETKRRSGKMNNFRKPPIRKQKSPVMEPEESPSEEVPESSNENASGVLPRVRFLKKRVIESSEDQEDEEVIVSSDENAPGIPSVRVLKGRVIISSEDQQEDDEDEVDEEEEVDELEEEYEEEESRDEDDMDVDYD